MDSSMYAEMAEMERNHWWFVGRRAVVFDVLQRTISKGKLLDVGLGTGFNAQQFLKRGFQVDGLDPAPEAIEFARKIAPEVTVIQSLFPSTHIPSATYDGVVLLDVVEHLEDDVAALSDVRRVLKDGGFALMTVPAFRFLWTKHDERAHHFRRYRKNELVRVIRAAGLEPVQVSYYNFFLFPPIALVRLISKMIGLEETSDFDKTPGILNGLLGWMFGFERFLLRFVSLPFGVSLIAVARKPLP